MKTGEALSEPLYGDRP